ncbi:MAG TPA: DUF433 domain-containing protein [Bryobacteraceae bacterium]|nr:DUF433 domain-containing protein [Bryobacteraceae bacterium]
MTAEQRQALESAIMVNPEVLHGTPCFKDSRVPVQTLLDFLEDGDSVDGFLSVYPSIPRERVVAFLELSRDITIEQLCASS